MLDPGDSRCHVRRPCSVETAHGLEEYVAFIALIAALYVTAGGIHISGNPRGTPRVNAAFLAIGAVAASLIGTTGASMLLIRPLLDANQEREHKSPHRRSSSSSSSPTPAACSPRSAIRRSTSGYLNGVPFFFTLRLFPAWLLAQAMLLTAFVLWDRRMYARETPAALALDAAHETGITD